MLPALVVCGVIASASVLLALAPSARASILRDCTPASGVTCPTPTPIPVHAFLSLDVTSGDATTVINVTGGQFNPNQTVTLYWDDPSKVAGGATADTGGSFNTRVKPFAADSPGVHKLCASVQPNPCANFSLTAPVASPSATPSPSATAPPTADSTPISLPTASPAAATLNGLGVITSPPFVFLPIVGVLAILLSVGYWFVNYLRQPRIAPLPSAAVVNRVARPDYTAGFGTPPAAPARPQEPSAWNEPVHPVAPPTPPSQPEPAAAADIPPAQAQPELPSETSQVEWGAPVEWGTGSGDWGFPEPPEVDDSPEIPQPGD